VSVVPAIFGNFTIDDLVFSDGLTQWAVPGGSAAYAALGAALWAGSSTIVAPVSGDYPLQSLGARVELSRCRRISHTLRNWGLYEDDGRRSFISRSNSRNWSDFSPNTSDVVTGFQTAAHVAPLPIDLAEELIRELRAKGATLISLDLDNHDLIGGCTPDRLMQMVNAVDLFLPSDQELLSLYPSMSPLEALRKLREQAPNIRLIAIKCGADGVIAHSAGMQEWISIPAIPVAVVDVTGAGDAFCGGVLSGFANQADDVEALMQGSVSASFCIEEFGVSCIASASREAAVDRVQWLRERVVYRPL
jgi:sugar/nucleoside kinase (ribokinase family)